MVLNDRVRRIGSFAWQQWSIAPNAVRHRDGSANECQSRVEVNADASRRWP
jgi:hypothetical protein